MDYCKGKLTTKGDACACGPPVSSGIPTHNPSISLACSGDDAESCGAPGSAIVYNLQGASGVTINSNSGNTISNSGNDNNSDNNSNNGNDSDNDSGNDSGNNSGHTNGSNPSNGSISSSSFSPTPSSSVGRKSSSSFRATASSSVSGIISSSVGWNSSIFIGRTSSSSIGGTVTASPPPFPGGPPPAGRSGPAEIPPDSSSSAAAAAATQMVPQSARCLQGDYTIPIKTQASCPGDDFSKATDPYEEATVYNISCRTTLGGDSLPPVHADSFDACLHFCDTYRGCIGVSYVNATGVQSANCVAYRSFMGCQTAKTPSNNYIAAAAANGSVYATNYQSNTNAICLNATYNTVPYIDPETKYQYKISCGYIYSTTTNLPAAAVDSFRGCVAYCAAQSACKGVLYAGRGPTDGGATNCYPYSSASGNLQKYYLFSVAVS